jgi:16S rRNA (uracil1498-N3)-methyltransferase
VVPGEYEPLVPEPVLTVAAAATKKGAFESMVEWTSQLPVNTILPFRSARTLPEAGDLKKNTARLKEKAVTALKQAEKAWLTHILEPVTFEEMLDAARKAGYACLFEKTAQSPDSPCPERLKQAGGIFIIVGPEGGLTEHEITAVRECGIPVAGLGDARLRAEAAVFAAAVKILTLKGDLA